MKKQIAFLVFGISLNAVAADFQCFEYSKIDANSDGSIMLPSVVTRRVVRENVPDVVFQQEIIALNEETDDFLSELKVGERVCLKGRKGFGSLAKFFAYEVRRESVNN